MTFQKAKWKIRCVIYDCDGVLFDSLKANKKLYNDLRTSLGRPLLTEEETTYAQSHTAYESIHFLFGQDPRLEKRALDRLKQMDLREYIGHLKIEPALLQTLTILKERGIFRAINTNRTTSMNYIMDRFDLWPHFDMVVTALDVKNPKPHPESIEKILQRLNVKKEEVVFIGDSEVDQQTAQSSGILFIAYKNGEIPHDAMIEDHLELLNLVGNP